VIEMRRAQLGFGDDLAADEVSGTDTAVRVPKKHRNGREIYRRSAHCCPGAVWRFMRQTT
jgi:hypothetical protein